jgi:hypothetical protein
MKKNKYILVVAILFILAGLASGIIGKYYYSLNSRQYFPLEEQCFSLMGYFLYFGVSLFIINFIIEKTKNPKVRLTLSFLAIFILTFYMIFWISMPFEYRYVSSDGEFHSTACPGKGYDYDYAQRQFDEYIKENNKKDVYLCRKFPRKLYNIFGWPWYLFHPRWQFPYKEP